MTKQDADKQFKNDVMPGVVAAFEMDGVPDYPARAEAWNNWTDGLCKDEVITLGQYETWTAPASCRAPWEKE